MNSLMFELRSFVHKQLYAAAEDILGQVERTITLALCDPEVRPPGYLLNNTTGSEVQLTHYSIEQGSEIQGSSTQEESTFILNPAVPGPSGVCSNQGDDMLSLCLEETDYKIQDIKEEQEELGDGGNVDLLSTGIVKEEIPLDSSEYPAGLIENRLVDGIEEQSATMNENADMLQEQIENVNQMAALPDDEQLKKVQKKVLFCYVCGKAFRYFSVLTRHIRTHEHETDCGACGLSFNSTKRLVTHLKSHHEKSHFCEVCGKTFHQASFLRRHKLTHLK